MCGWVGACLPAVCFGGEEVWVDGMGGAGLEETLLQREIFSGREGSEPLVFALVSVLGGVE